MAGRAAAAPIPEVLRRRMERAFATSFADVDVRRDPSVADLDATAVTRGHDVRLAPAAPAMDSPDGTRLLAHELAHVLQQRTAGSVDRGAVELAGSAAELGAEAAADRVMAGGRVSLPALSHVAGHQRQQVPDGADLAEVTRALAGFLRRARAAQGGRSVVVTDRVRVVFLRLADTARPSWTGAGGDPQRVSTGIAIETYLSGTLPGSPEDLAAGIARRLPSPFRRSALESLLGAAPATTRSLGEQVVDVISGSGAGSPESAAYDEATRRARGEQVPDTPSPRALQTPTRPTAEEEGERLAQVDRRTRGVDEPTVYGPLSLDVLQIFRIGAGIHGVLNPLAAAATAAVGAFDPAVARAASTLPNDLLVPEALRGTARAANFPLPGPLAQEVAQVLASAATSQRSRAWIDLGGAYRDGAEKLHGVGALRRLLRTIAPALDPHGVATFEVRFAGRTFTAMTMPR